MPVHNEENTLMGAVSSVVGQTHQNLEILVIDGGSTDGTPEIARALAAGDGRIRLLANPALSIPSALNVGLAAASGDYVARVDAHAHVNAEYLAIALQHLKSDLGLAAVGGQRVAEATTRTGRAIGLALSSPFGVGDSINHYSSETQETDHASFGVYRADIARQVGGWDEALPANEDVDFDFRILNAGFRILYNPRMRIHWYVRETLSDLAHQYRRYGRGKGTMIRKNGPTALRIRHLAPPILIANLGLGAAVALRRPVRGAALVAPYAALLTMATIRTRGQAASIDASIFSFPAALATMHIWWGLGFYEGLAGRTPALASQRPTG